MIEYYILLLNLSLKVFKVYLLLYFHIKTILYKCLFLNEKLIHSRLENKKRHLYYFDKITYYINIILYF